MALPRREGHLAAHRAAARERDAAIGKAEQRFDLARLRRLVVGEQPAVRRLLEDALSHQLAHFLLRACAALHAAHADVNVLFHKWSPLPFFTFCLFLL